MWESKYALKRLDRLDPQHLTLGPRHHTWGMPRLAEKTPSEPQLQQFAGCSRVGFFPYTNRQHGTLNGASRVWRHVSNIVQLCFELKSFKVHGWRPVKSVNIRSPISRQHPPAVPVCVWTPRTSHQHISELPQSLGFRALGRPRLALHNSIGHSSHGKCMEQTG